jgi:hypothetical protein
MSDAIDRHAPTDDFVEYLARDILRTARHGARFARASRSHAPRRRVVMVFGIAAGVVLALATGLVVGASASYASAEIIDANERAATSGTFAATRSALASQLDLARENYDRVRAAVDKGMATPSALSAAETQVNALAASIARIDLQLRVSRAVPQPSRPMLAILPIRSALHALGCVTVASEVAQQTVPLVELSPVTAKTTQTLGVVFGLKEVADGRLLVNDAVRHQVRLFEPSLGTSKVVLDSVPGSAISYGAFSGPLVPFVGDSSLLYDDRTRGSMLVLDGRGTVVRALSFALSGQLLNGRSGVDANGRLVYRYKQDDSLASVPRSGTLLPPVADGAGGSFGGGRGRAGVASGVPMTTAWVVLRPDSMPIHRADLGARRVDTVGYVANPLVAKLVLVPGKAGVVDSIKQVFNPLPTIDALAVLSDGTIAVVRGRDYHVDWIHPDGTKTSSVKLPFDWKPVTDDDKQRLIDSTRAAVVKADSEAVAKRAAVRAARAASGGRGGNAGVGSGDRFGGFSTEDEPGRTATFAFEFVPLSKMSDYWPPIRPGAALPDADGNLWILPRTTTLSKNGELVYDVVNPKGGLVRRVRLPVGRSIAGFGKGGVVFLQVGDLANGFTLERTTVPGIKPTPR